MHTAVFHDYFSTIGGGEKVAISIAECLHADIITTDIKISPRYFRKRPVYSLGTLPSTPGFHQITAKRLFEQSDYHKEYDLVVFSGNWAHHASRNHTPSLYYCNSPVRVFHDLYPVFLSRQPWYARPVFRLWAHTARRADIHSVNRITSVVANSRNIQNRILKYYGRDSLVIYPPVDTHAYYFKEYGDFWLSVNRLYPEKRIDLQIEAFRRMPEEQLVIVGGFSSGDHSSPYVKKIKEMAAGYPNIQIFGEIEEYDLIQLYSRCKGLVCTALAEDFGLTPLEAMASGKPVVAVAEGGFLETVKPECGALIGANVKEIIRAVQEISSNPDQYRRICIEQADTFNLERFNREIIAIARQTLEHPVRS